MNPPTREKKRIIPTPIPILAPVGSPELVLYVGEVSDDEVDSNGDASVNVYACWVVKVVGIELVNTFVNAVLPAKDWSQYILLESSDNMRGTRRSRMIQ